MIHAIEDILLEQFERELVNEIIEVSQFKELKKGDKLVNVGTYIKGIPLILNGVLKVTGTDEEGQELLLYYLQGGETCSMSTMCCVRQSPSAIKAIALTDTELLLIPSTKMEEWLGKYKTWRMYIFSNFQTRFNRLLKTLDDVAFKQLDERLLSFIDKQVELNQSDTIQITHKEIAQNLYTSRVVISRLLKQLETNGEVQLGRNTITRLS